MAEKKAKLIFKGYRIGESKILLDVNANDIKGEMDITLRNETKKLGNDNYEIALSTSVTNASKSMDIFVKMTARFEVEPTLDEDVKQSLIRVNAPAILFPYIRAYISSLTGLSGLAPIIIPPINMAAGQDNN